MVKIDFLLATFLLVLPAAWGGSPTTEPVSSNQQKRSPETVAPSAGSTTRQLHAQLGNQNIVKMMTATTTRGDFRTGLLQTPQPAASPMKSKLLTEDFNIRAKRSTSSSATPQEETLKNKVTINKVSQSPFLPSPYKTTPLQVVSETTAKLAQKTAKLTVAETTNGTNELDKTTINTIPTTVGLIQIETESSTMTSSISTTAPAFINPSTPSSTLTSKATHGRPATTNITHAKYTEGPTVSSKSKTSVPHDNLTSTQRTRTTTRVTVQSTTASTTRKSTRQKIKSETTSPKQNKTNSSPGVTVAVIISVVLILMIVVVLWLLLKKRWRQERNKEDPAWAGPTPFLDGEIQPRLIGVEDDSMVHKPSSKRVSLQSFLPRRSDKRQSLLKEEEDQVPMEDFQEGTTFGKVQNDSVNSNGTASIDGTTDKPQPPPETTSSTEGNVNLGQDPIEEEATTPVPPNDTLSAPTAPLLDVDLGPPIGEEAPLTPNDAPFVPPPPPMPSEK